MRQYQPNETPNQSFFDDFLEWTHWLVQQALDNSQVVMGFAIMAATLPIAAAQTRQQIREYDEAYCYSDGYCYTRHAREFREGDRIVTEYEYNLRDNNMGRRAFHQDPRFEGRNPVFHPNRDEINPINIARDFNGRVDHPNPDHPFHANNGGLFRHAPPGYRRDPGDNQEFQPHEQPDFFQRGPRI